MGKGKEKKYKTADEMKKNLELPNPVPPGNKVAHYIRSVHNNSYGMFPSTAGSRRSYDKYNTVTNLSFSGPDDFYIAPGELAAGDFPRKRETIEEVLLSPRKTQMFTSWKVPERMVDGKPIPETIPEEAEPAGSVHSDVVRAKPDHPPPVPVSRQMSLPNIQLKGPASPRVASRAGSRNGLQPTTPVRTPRAEARLPLPLTPRRCQTMVLDSKPMPLTPRRDTNGAPLRSALLPEAVPQAEEWMKHANEQEKRVIERVLRMASKKHELENSMRKTLLPDAKQSVDKWMQEASDQDRDVALKFFTSLAGGQLMGMTVDGQRQRLKDVINTLEEGQGKCKVKPQQGRRRPETISDGNLRYVRLLTPKTRNNRWMHTTWHHLPAYNQRSIVENSSSHYTRPQGLVPRHYVIHPDWG